jgi:hypothetical protein
MEVIYLLVVAFGWIAVIKVDQLSERQLTETFSFYLMDELKCGDKSLKNCRKMLHLATILIVGLRQ